MSIRSIKKVLTIIILAPLIGSCGELDTVLPSSGTYQVKALVNGTSLDDCSLVNAGDAIQPYFASPVANDPDITGLTVFLRNSRGETLGGKTVYTLESGTEGDSQTGSVPAQYGKSGTVLENPASRGNAGTTTARAAPQSGGAGTVIPVKRLDKNLPGFPMPEKLAIGQYTLVFNVMGEKEILYQTEKNIYYLHHTTFLLKEIQMYLPDLATGSRLVPPGSTIMLEARLDVDPRLDPYIRWYNGKKLINEGSLSSGAARFLWKAPAETGFHSVRAEAFPSRLYQGIAGSSREISIPVSAKASGVNLVDGDEPELLYRYQFNGSLRDSKSSVSTERELVPQEEQPPHWSPSGHIYGLLSGPDDVYLLPAVSFVSRGTDEGGGRLLFRFKPLAEGRIFSALFAPAGSQALEMNLSLSGETLVLSVGVDGFPAGEITAPVPASGEYITAAVDFVITAHRFEAALDPAYSGESQNEDSYSDAYPDARRYATSVTLATPLSGECVLRLGAAGKNAEDYSEMEPAAGAPTALWDEFAVLNARSSAPAAAATVSARTGIRFFFGEKKPTNNIAGIAGL